MTFPSLVVQGTAFHTPEPGKLDAQENCTIAVDASGKIESIHPANSIEGEKIVEGAIKRETYYPLARNQYLIPGLVDLHIHAPQWPQLGKALDAPLEDWLEKYTFPLEAKFSDHALAYEVYDDLVRTLLSHGTTTAVYFGSVDLQANVILAEACLRHGQRALVGKVAMDDPAQCPDYYKDENAFTGIRDTKRFIEAVRSLPGNDNNLVCPTITPRFIPSCTDELLYGLGKLSAETHCHIQTHCSESDWEVEFVRDRLNKTDTEALENYGLLTDKTILAHSNFVSNTDLELMATKGAAVAHCPLSNAYFANAVFPLRTALDHGVDVGLGTDISGGFSPSLFDAARYALMASRHACSGTSANLSVDKRGDGETPLTTIECFHLATAQAGQALSLPIGQFKPGYAFDALCIQSNADSSAFKIWDGLDTLNDIFEKLVLTADSSCIKNVWVNGTSTLSAF